MCGSSWSFYCRGLPASGGSPVRHDQPAGILCPVHPGSDRHSEHGDEDGRRFTPLFCSFFFFILTMNLVGLIPGFSSATSNLAVTGALAPYRSSS